MGGGTNAGGGRAARALRLLLLLVLVLAAVEYLFGSILDASPLRSYLYTPVYNSTPSTLKNLEKSESYFLKAVSASIARKTKQETNDTQLKNNSILIINNTNTNIDNSTSVKNITAAVNMTIQDLNLNGTGQFTKLTEEAQLEDQTKKTTETTLPLCDAMPPDLGPITVNKTELELAYVEKKFPEVQRGGHYKPPNCTARHKVAIIVPYRDRQQHLAIFLNHMHPFLMKQQIEYGIFIIEQEGGKAFNRAKLMNVGFAESNKLETGGWQCFIFHDIDLLPLDTRNMYSCPRQPRHMSAAIDKLHNRLPYEDIFGGVSAITEEQFIKVNGFSNKYWGWGGEDDDMFARLKKMNYHLARYKMSIARYAMLDHKKSAPNPQRYNLLSQTGKTFQQDGLSTLDYDLIRLTRYHLYTYILVNIDESS